MLGVQFRTLVGVQKQAHIKELQFFKEPQRPSTALKCYPQDTRSKCAFSNPTPDNSRPPRPRTAWPLSRNLHQSLSLAKTVFSETILKVKYLAHVSAVSHQRSQLHSQPANRGKAPKLAENVDIPCISFVSFVLNSS